jgi:hypothetical protein
MIALQAAYCASLRSFSRRRVVRYALASHVVARAPPAVAVAPRS